MLKVIIDNQVYENQGFGGINRYFDELQYGLGSIERMKSFKPESPNKKSFYSRFQQKIRPNTVSFNQPFLNKYEFYRAQLNTLDFDVFHPTYYDNYFLDSLKKPFVLTVHDMIHEKYPEYFGESPDSINKRRLCEAADRIIAISETTKKDIIDIFDTPEDKIKVIYHATNFDSIHMSKPDINFQEKNYLLFTGNRDKYKNFLTFLIAVSSILKAEMNLILVCTGPDFNKIEKKWIKDLELEESVLHYYCANDNELAYLYGNAECFIFPSLYEGFGLPLLESFACNCPVVCSPGGSLREIAGEAAFYFDPKNLKSIRESIYKVISDRGLKEELINSGKKRLEEFAWDKCRKETLAVYSELV